MAVSALCAIHCAVMPLMLGVPTAWEMSWLFGEEFDWLFLASSGAIGCASILPAYRFLHRRKRCVTLFLCGVASILAGRLAPLGVPDTPLVVFGAALIISAHATNQYFCRCCRRCSS